MMMMRFVPLFVSAVLVFGIPLSSVAYARTAGEAIEQTGQYWQRISSSSAIYTRGPKAQQMLNRDISRCVVELRELERLGEIKNAIPKYVDEGRILSEAEAKLSGVDTTERDQELFYEHTEYHDFEGCMLAKGWERIKYVPYDVAEQARENYLNSHVKTRKSDRTTGLEVDGIIKDDGNDNYDHLNP